MSNHSQVRRNVLLGMLAAVSALCLKTGIAAEGSVGKISKAQAKYQNQPKGGQKCAGCMHFIPGSNTCKVVEGAISPDGWCMLWVKKQG